MNHIVQRKFPSWLLHDLCPRLVGKKLAASLCFDEIGPVSLNQMSVELCWGEVMVMSLHKDCFTWVFCSHGTQKPLMKNSN